MMSLPAVAKALQEGAGKGRSVGRLLKKLSPHIHRQIVEDGKHPHLLSFWGRSVNFDENAGKTIVDPAIVAAIGHLAGVPMDGRVVHAGLQHTYGYLFSLIETPYGFKRDRWVSEDWERGFGLDDSLLGPDPREGTLFANLSWFLGQVVFRGQPFRLRSLARDTASIATELLRYDFSVLSVDRLVEEVNHPRDIRICTDLVPFPLPPKDRSADNTVLIYSIQNGQRSSPRLITAFTVQAEVARQLKNSASAGQTAVILRYNAYLPGLFGKTTPGRRSLVRR